ncbi:MAG TPA: hypothetical protein VGJ70_17965, partial [Solirubrobacteraceae bacterium]
MTAEPGWRDGNREYLVRLLSRLRLRLRRRALWLRRQWERDDLREYRAAIVSDAEADRRLRGDDDAAEAAFYREDADAAALTEAIAADDRALVTIAGA